jgi:hypothetical protein
MTPKKLSAAFGLLVNPQEWFVMFKWPHDHPWISCSSTVATLPWAEVVVGVLFNICLDIGSLGTHDWSSTGHQVFAKCLMDFHDSQVLFKSTSRDNGQAPNTAFPSQTWNSPTDKGDSQGIACVTSRITGQPLQLQYCLESNHRHLA